MRRVVPIAVLVVLVAAGLVYFRNGQPTWFERIRYPLHYEQIVRGHARNYHLDPRPARRGHLPGEQVPSRTRNRARGRSGSCSCARKPPRASRIRTGGTQFQVSDLYNPEINVRYGSWYLRHLLDKYGDEKDALAAYNAGQRNVDEWRAEGKDIQFPETRAYVDRVEHLKGVYARAYHL